MVITINLLDLFIKIGIDDQATGKMKSIVSNLGSAFSTVATTGLKAIGAASAAVGGFAAKATDSYADFEQLVGGVETLFGLGGESLEEYAERTGQTVRNALNEWDELTKGQRIVFDNAEEAYKTAGMSANDYMETVTSLSARLLQGLEGDTVAAADVAQKAVLDMADNANKMGTDITLIQNAYQGFAKQNYSMLDNLKLGFGGTAEEMTRLVNESGVLGEGISIYKEKLSSIPFDQIIEAIHIVQTNMGITGTTAKEAATTISGSIASMKAAGQNLITGLANGKADIKDLVGDFVETAQTGWKNFITAFETALDQMPILIDNIVPPALNLFVEAAETVLPKIVESGSKIISSLVGGITENSDKISETAINTVSFLAESVIKEVPKIVETGGKLLVSLGNGVIDKFPSLLDTTFKVINYLADKLTSPSSFNTILDTAGKIVTFLTEGLVKAVPKLGETAFTMVSNFIDYILDPTNIEKIVATAVEMVGTLSFGLISSVDQLLAAAGSLVEKLIDKFIHTDWLDVGKNIVLGLIDGIKNTWKNLTELLGDGFDGLIKLVTGKLDEHSPSRVFAKIGENMALGLGEGWMDTFAGIKDDIGDSVDFNPADYTPRISPRRSRLIFSDDEPLSGFSGLTGSRTAPVYITQNIYASKMTPSEVMAEAQYQQKKAVLSGV